MIYENLVTQNKVAFLAKVQEIAAKLKIQADWLMIVMKMESGLNHQAVNPTGGATGLIQFMPATAQGLGTSTAALKSMTNVQQLEYVWKYFAPYSGRIKGVTDLYTVTFFPVALGQPDNYVLQTSTKSAGLIASQNPVFDTNKDKSITIGEFKAYVISKLPAEALAYLKKN